MPEELYQTMKRLAEEHRRSLTGELLVAIEYYLAHAPEAQYRVEPAPEPPKPKRRKT